MQREPPSQEIVKITDPRSPCRQNCKWMPPTSFPRPHMKPGDEADCSLLISSQKQGPRMRPCKRLMRNPVAIVFSVCSGANVEHVAAVREPGGLQCPVQNCQTHFRPLTDSDGGMEAWRKWNRSICAEQEGNVEDWTRISSSSAEWSSLIYTHALFARLMGAEVYLISPSLSQISGRVSNHLFEISRWLLNYL